MDTLQAERPVEKAGVFRPLAAGIAAAALLDACSGGDNSAPASTPDSAMHASLKAAATSISSTAASRFLSQAAFGGNDTDIAAVQAQGYAGWLQDQFTTASDQNNWDWLMANGFDVAANLNAASGIDATLWRKLMASKDKLRQRVALALSEIFVVSVVDLHSHWKSFAAAAYMDMLAANAFGNFRTLLQAVTLSPAMGCYLGTRGNEKENPATGREADENYAREVMQLFTIGLYQLNNDGSQILDGGGNPVPTYNATTVTQLAQVFTGWNFDGYTQSAPNYLQVPMTLNPAQHSTSAKPFLGASVPAGTDGNTALKIALDALFNHPNVPAFFGKQLIQKFVTSNPSPAYIGRVAAAFISGTGSAAGVRGDMKSVISAVLLDPEAQTAPGATNPAAGKVREPILRLAQWARTFNARSPSGQWAVGDTSSSSYRLGQSPLRSPTVFNFFSPGFVPPNNVLGNPSLVAPELQIVTESTVIGYVNFMQQVVAGQLADITPDYSNELALASNPAALVARLNTLLAAGQLSSATTTAIQNAIGSISLSGANAASGASNRVKAAVLLVMSTPEYLVQK
ncbi:MAG TPA: DUF1800 domain-containing protein [Burkholderiaceae bacterium]